MRLFQAKPLTFAHKCMGIAALLGAGFVVLHMVTVAVTCSVEGFGWGFNAWFFDIAGFLAGAFFAVQCGLSSNAIPADFRQGNQWIFVWALVTFCVRILDTLMLTGVVKWNAIYETPTGLVFWSNFVSEIIVGMAFAVTALVGSATFLYGKGRVSGRPS